MFDLSGRRALVTGGGRGVGAGIVECLAARGAAVAVNDVVGERASTVAAHIGVTGGRAVAVPFDIRERAQVDEGVALATEQLGGSIDILVNNAGPTEGMAPVRFAQMDPEAWADVVELNLYGSLNCIRAVLDPMVASGHGRIVQISSGAGRTGVSFGVSLYGAAKSAVEGFVRHLAMEVARDGVTVNALALGLLDNAVPPGAPDDAVSALAGSVPVGRLGGPDDVGPAVVYLASDEAAWMTGQTIGLNGGSTTS